MEGFVLSAFNHPRRRVVSHRLVGECANRGYAVSVRLRLVRRATKLPSQPNYIQ